MDSAELPDRSTGPSLAYALLLVVVGGLFWLGSRDIGRTGASQANDPGPRAFPAALAGTLFVAGALYGTWGIAQLADRQRRRALLTVVAMTAYVGLMPVAGFSLATFAFAFCMLVALGAGWWRAACVSAALVALVQLLFRQLFHVILPEINSLNW